VAAYLYNISIRPSISTGPFVVKEFVKGSHITFARTT
jgi:ABC-type transport system substrate-binding protein